MFAHLNKITSGQEKRPPTDKSEKSSSSNVWWVIFLSPVSNWGKETRSIFPCRTITSTLPRKNWQLPFFNVVKLNFYDVASLSLPFQITSCSDIHEIANSVKSLFSFLSMRWVIKSVSARNFCPADSAFRNVLKYFHSKLDSISNPLPLHEVKSNEG